MTHQRKRRHSRHRHYQRHLGSHLGKHRQCLTVLRRLIEMSHLIMIEEMMRIGKEGSKSKRKTRKLYHETINVKKAATTISKMSNISNNGDE